MKPFIVIQLRPEDETADNEYQSILRFGELAPEDTLRIRAEQASIPDLDLDQYSGIIVGGSPFDITTPEDEKSEVQKRVQADFTKLLTEVIKRDIPFLGACSGNGLLGNHCGAPMSRKYGEPVRGIDVHITEAGQNDPLLAGLPSPFRALNGHKEACEAVPENATLLAYTATCPVSMFRVGHNVYATQFHPEACADDFVLRIAIYKNHGYFPPEDADQLTHSVQNEDTQNANEILRRFVARYKTS